MSVSRWGIIFCSRETRAESMCFPEIYYRLVRCLSLCTALLGVQCCKIFELFCHVINDHENSHYIKQLWSQYCCRNHFYFWYSLASCIFLEISYLIEFLLTECDCDKPCWLFHKKVWQNKSVGYETRLHLSLTEKKKNILHRLSLIYSQASFMTLFCTLMTENVLCVEYNPTVSSIWLAKIRHLWWGGCGL